MLLRPLFCCILFFFLSACAYAQDSKGDSLRNVINSNADDNNKLKAYRVLTELYVTQDFDEAMSASLAGLTLSQKVKDPVQEAFFEKEIGLSHYFKGTYDSAAIYYYRAIDILNKTTAVEDKAEVFNVLARLYRKTKDLDRSLQIYDEAYAIYKQKNNLEGMSTILNESGVVFEYKEDYNEAINRYSQSLAICEKTHNVVGQAYSINFIGGVLTLQKKYPEAEKYLIHSLEIRKQLKDTLATALNYADLGYMYTQKGDYTKATEQYNSAINLANAMNYPDLLLTSYKSLSEIAEKKGDVPLALSYYKKHVSLKDSIYSDDKMKQIEQLNAKYQTEKKEHQLQSQNVAITKKNYQLAGLLTGILLFLTVGIAFFRRRQLQNKMHLQAAVMKQQDIATRAIIEAEENERKRIAADLHDGVGQMMSAAKMNLSAYETDIPFKDAEQKLAFERIISLVDESCKEIRSVSHQMMPNALLKSGLANAVKEFIDKIDGRVLKVSLHSEGLNERLDGNTETILYRVIQECVNNVIKHSGADQLDISLIKDVDGIAATIEDNGRGFDATDKTKFDGIGLKNITSRIDFLKGTVEFDSSPGNGTLVAIHVPLV